MATDSWTIKPRGPTSATIKIQVDRDEHRRPGLAVVTCVWVETGCLASPWPITIERWSSGYWVPFGALSTGCTNLRLVAEALAMDLAGYPGTMIRRVGK